MSILFYSSFALVAQDVVVTLGTASQLLNYAGVPIFQWFPDGHISILKEVGSEDFAMYWAGHQSYRTTGIHPYPEYQLKLTPANKILGDKTDVDAWDNGGSWLMSVFRVEGNTLVGFFHAEDHYYGTDNPGNIAWKSIGRVISYDNGFTWEQPEQIITSNKQKPTTPEWGGVGDHSVIWDEVNNRWLCYFQDNFIMLAMSEDPLGRPGTWYKYHEGSFSQPGLEGMSTKVNGLTIAGANPSVHFNHYLNKYVVVYHGWNGNIYFSTSLNGIDWQTPVKIVTASTGRRTWYPTIIGANDLSAGKVARLYYSDMGSSSRNFIGRAILFDEVPTYKPSGWKFEKIGSFAMQGSFDSLSTESYRILSFEGILSETATYGYHYREIDDSFKSSFRLSIDSEFPGSIGYAIRSGVNDNDEEMVFAYNGDHIVLKNGNELVGGLSGNSVDILVEKIDEDLVISYKNQEGEWVVIYSAVWNWPSSLVGFFTIGSPDQPSLGYVSDLIIEPFVPVGVDRLENADLSIYPNPVKGTLHIIGCEQVRRIMLMNSDGQIVRNTKDCDKLSIGDLSNGVYVLKLILNNGEYKLHRIIISN